MAKGQSLNSKFTGKMGSVVFSISNGVQIAREYTGQVANPNTVPQVNQRAKFKLLSQLATALSPVIVMQRVGLVSSRNRFVTINNEFVTAANGEASVSYENLQLTESQIGLPSIVASRSDSNLISVALSESAAASCARVIYVFYRKTAEQQLQYLASAVVEEAGDDGTFPTTAQVTDGDIIIWAFGMRDKTKAASVKYQNYNVASGEDIARLYMNRSLGNSDYQYTQTRGITLFGSSDETINPSPQQVMVYIQANGDGSVSGEGFTNNRKAVTVGESCTVHATASEGAQFIGWYNVGETEGTALSTQADYTFSPSEATDLVAKFSSTNDDNNDTGGFDLGS